MKSKIQSDKECVRLLKAGKLSAFDILIERYTEKVFRLSMRITRNQEDAEDVLQEVFTSVFAKIGSFKEKSAFSSWLYRITVNTAYMKLRDRKKHATVNIEGSNVVKESSWVGKRSDINDVTFMSIRSELKKILVAAVGSLPKDYQAIFILRDMDGLSNKEVANALSLSVPAVKSRLHRARLALRKDLGDFFKDYKSETEISYGSKIAS